jgi:hypothetical protein
MKPRNASFKFIIQAINSSLAVVICLALLIAGDPAAFATAMQPQAPAAETNIPNDQLDSLVAPIALYPDPILSQVLIASTYPLEIVQLSQWMQKNSKMPPEKMAEEVKKQQWDPSIQAMVVLPDLVKNLNENIKWTTDLGNAFLAQQNDVMDAVQRMRVKAKDKGALQSTEQQKVETKVVENKEVIVIQPTKTEVVYVPSYNPTVVYGAPAYPYPVYAYPPPPPPGAYVAAAAVTFGVGMMVGAAWGNNYCCNAGWGGGNNNVYINNSNNYVNNSNRQNVQGGNRNNVNSGNSSWQHNSQHRGGTPYSNSSTAQKYGGTAQGANRQANAQSQAGSRQQAGTSQSGNRGASANTMGAQGGNRGASASTSNRSGSGGGGGDRIGGQSVSSGSGSRGGSSGGSGAFGGSGGSSRSSSMASSSRGSSSMGGGGSRGGGGGSRGGGGRRR